MLKSATLGVACVCALLVVWPGVARGQQVSPEDEIINAIRQRTDIGESDQRRIADWVEAQVGKFAGFTGFRDRFQAQCEHSGNSQQFRIQFAAQTAQVATAQFAKPALGGELAYSLAYVLAVVINRVETYPALVAGLKSQDVRARYLCAKGLSTQKTSIAADRAGVDEVVQALREAGLAESSPVVLGRIYEALAYTGQAASVFDTYMALFDKRLEYRRGPAVIADGAEIYAYEFFRTGGVLGALEASQKSQLVAGLAVFLRMDAQRYDSPGLKFDEIDKLERSLDAVEEILAVAAGSNGGKIRDVLQSGGYDERSAVLKEAYRWVGNPETKESGVLNEAPWNVPVGAP